jgi:hypothetical protein
MDDSALWVAALGIGAVGFLLLALAGMIAMYLNTKPSSTKDTPPTNGSRPHARADAPTEEPRPRAGEAIGADRSQAHASQPRAKPRTIGGFWAWVKAWIFASVHAGTVSVVLGGITFFEDLANASEEIQRTGNVTFPKRLLPGTLSGSESRERLSGPSGALLRDGHPHSTVQGDGGNEDQSEAENPNQPDASSPNAPGWEVIDSTSG